MALEKDWTRRPYGFWVFEQGMDDEPIGGEQGQIILDRKLYRNETERQYPRTMGSRRVDEGDRS